jgi:hypothetical protein
MPLYGAIWQVSAGLTASLGLADGRGPAIDADFPSTAWGPWYISPNLDGRLDSLEFPLRITDRRYVASWVLRVYPKGSGGPGGSAFALRSIANKESRPGSRGLADFWQRLLYVKKGVPVPDRLSWNGFDDRGEKVADGGYELWIEAADDDGHRTRAGPFPIFVDTSPPAASIAPGSDSLVFSPD